MRVEPAGDGARLGRSQSRRVAEHAADDQRCAGAGGDHTDRAARLGLVVERLELIVRRSGLGIGAGGARGHQHHAAERDAGDAEAGEHVTGGFFVLLVLEDALALVQLALHDGLVLGGQLRREQLRVELARLVAVALLALGLRPREQGLDVGLERVRLAEREARRDEVALAVRDDALVELRLRGTALRRGKGADRRAGEHERDERGQCLSVRTGMNGESAFHAGLSSGLGFTIGRGCGRTGAGAGLRTATGCAPGFSDGLGTTATGFAGSAFAGPGTGFAGSGTGFAGSAATFAGFATFAGWVATFAGSAATFAGSAGAIVVAE